MRLPLQLLLGVAALVLVWGVFTLWRRRRGSSDGYPERATTGAPGLQVGTLTRKVSDFEGTVERHAQQMQALRTEFRQRLDALEGRLREMERRVPPPATQPPVAPPPRGFPEMETYGVTLADPAPGWDPGASGRPVEVRDGTLVVSHSLPPTAYVVPEGQGKARVFLNGSVEINEFALPKWEAFFEMRGARPYATYRTVRPAEVSWDTAAERGSLITMGVAEAV